MGQYDNFTEGMGASNAVNKMNGSMDSSVGHNHSTNLGNGCSSIPGTSISGAVASATNVTTNINNHAISDILESDGTTAKTSTKLTSGKWVEITSGSRLIPHQTYYTVDLRPYNQHHIYSYDVYTNGASVTLGTYGTPWCEAVLIKGSIGNDYLYMANNFTTSASDYTFYYKIWVWE